MSAIPTPLADQEIARRLGGLPGWRREGAALARTLAFADYMAGIDFVNRVAAVAEKMDHHPDLLVSWKKVTVRLTSHDAGGITARDFGLAERINQLCPPQE